MILIISNSNDITTNDTIDWLVSFFRINEGDKVYDLSIDFDSNIFNIVIKNEQSRVLQLKTINSFWYRRNDLEVFIDEAKLSTESQSVQYNLLKEWLQLKNYMYHILKEKRSLGSHQNEVFHNKLVCLSIATKIGISIPKTKITTFKDDLEMFISKNGVSITKAISNMFKIQTPMSFQTIPTQIITFDNLRILEDSIYPALIQKKIEKAFELRIFYMKNKFFPMAIFSQNDEKTKLDYRNYNREKPNRNIPYILPKDIEEKLQKLMDKLDLDSGSIDMIVTPEGEYVFLEVNPTGQFGWVSENCNYYLEEKIANYLQGEA
jgi:ATP-GRASP peptide maturase of grasp-with-spasm system